MELTPPVQALYSNLTDKLKEFGPFVIEEKKTSFHVVNRAAFAGIHPRKDYFIVNIVSAEAIKNPRITKCEQVSKSRFHNELKIEKVEDIDSQLLTWLKEAYHLMA